MFILRFIGRILSIGLILFIMFIVSNNTKAGDTCTAGVSVTQGVIAVEIEYSAIRRTLGNISALTPLEERA
ncbi:MAG: hypothetical protein OEM98_18300 [Gammaproteobacteria bacterium]|nr:hypothetical protein [Gammaproteobacteria bacterium]